MADEDKKKELLKKFFFQAEEEAELVSGVKEKTGFPKPEYFYRLVTEAINLPIEEAYFWTIDELKYGWSYNRAVKITDINAASEGSSFFGLGEQRIGMQQDKAAQFLKGISEMLKALFQIVRELRIIDERLGYYNHTFNRNAKKKDEDASGSEITLKGIWVDQVEGGVKNAASVYGLSQTVGFTILPDLFFRVRADDIGLHEVAAENFDSATNRVVSNVDKAVDGLKFNEKVKEVLKRKLTQYYMWKLRTYQELKTRRKFTIKYLKQHYDTIKLYMGWIKPYLRNIQRLQMAEKLVRSDMPDLITAFEGALVEIEVLTYKETKSKYKPCVLVHMYYRTRPALSYVQEGYQRGPMHTGKFDLILRGYVWSEDQIKNYINMKEEEDLNLLSSVNESIKEALDSLGEELKTYLKEGGEIFEEEKKEKKEPNELAETVKGAAEPFVGVLGGIKEIVSPLTEGIPSLKKKGGPKKGKDVDDTLQIASMKRDLKRSIFQTYKNYKKMHGLMTW
ncbi:hypothetical protein CMO88_02155 [Candidatus Woesearchaeota archaeon]|nr:hypothetical protein [Candidatus Woesearchaeota archaeon]|tara:strand:- start:11630 stop:13150 length:1521 start_codon:yes stop_codon:yes gene_type:complete